jgi:hypothetical protein
MSDHLMLILFFISQNRRVQCFSSSPTDCSFDPSAIFQLVPGAYNRVEMRYRPNKVGSAKIQVST